MGKKANSVCETVCLSGQNTHILRQETCGKDFIFMKILKNALFLTPLYFESNFEKCAERPTRSTSRSTPLNKRDEIKREGERERESRGIPEGDR